MNTIEYKPVSALSVLALITGVVSITSFLLPVMLVCAICSLAVAALSIQRIHRYNISGTKMTVVSVFLAGSTLILAPAWHSHLFNSETLPGYLRVDLPEANLSRSTALDQYANKAVCLKGYVITPTQAYRLRTFQLSPDGNDAKPEIAITVTCPTDWEYHPIPIAVSGILTVDQNAAYPAQRYVLSAVAIRPSYTSYYLGPRVPRRGC